MHKCTIRFIRGHGASEKNDDILRVFEDDTTYRVLFRPQEYKKFAEFFLDKEDVLGYISNILHSLTHDTYPFHEIQVDTIIHPSVLYHVSDLENSDTRRLVLDAIEDALTAEVELVHE
jgi:hypothetical protein